MLYLEAAYRSHHGVDYFSVGAILHNSTVNRKDTPFGIDEKQHIDIEVQTQHEIQKVSINGSATLAGTFRLQLGGKHSRQIDANASAADVAAAVRELVSNCAGDYGLESDSSGSTFECWQGMGQNYRGLASTTNEGVKCKVQIIFCYRFHLL